MLNSRLLRFTLVAIGITQRAPPQASEGRGGQGGCISVRHTECWRSLWPAGGIHGQGDPRGLLDGVLDLASRIHVLLMPSKSTICFSPRLFPPFSQAVHYSILWMRLERNKSLWQHPPQLGKQGTHSHAQYPPCDKSWAKKVSLGPELCHFGVPFFFFFSPSNTVMEPLC